MLDAGSRSQLPFRRSRPFRRFGPSLLALACAVALVLSAGAARADDIEDAMPSEFPDGLTGKQIYQRVVANRFDAYRQVSKLTSSDRGGSAQESQLKMQWRNYRTDGDFEQRKVESKTLVKYTHPFDMRYSGYLIINNETSPNDQFVYLASRRRVRRVNLRGEAVFGTDFSFEDVVPREVEESTYRRLPNELVDGVDCFVVEATPKPETESEYSRFVVYVHTERYVPLTTRYWNTAGVEIKRLTVPPGAIEAHDGVNVPMRMTMRHLLHESETALEVKDLEANPPDMRDKDFDLRRLEGH